MIEAEKNEEKNTGGRPATYDDNYHPYVVYAFFWDNQAAKTDDLAARLGVTRETINAWIKSHTRFSDAYKRCRAGLKGQLIYAALKEAKGYNIIEKTTSEKGVTETERWMRPQAGILKLLLSNFGIKEQVETVKVETVTEADVLKNVFESAKSKVSADEYSVLLSILSKVAND